MIDRTLLRFGLVGIGNTVLGLGVIFGARQFVDDFTANLIGYLLVVPVSFLTHRELSFRDVGRKMPAFLRYLTTVAIGYSFNVVVLKAGLAAGGNPYMLQAAGITVYVGITYLLSRHVVFLQAR